MKVAFASTSLVVGVVGQSVKRLVVSKSMEAVAFGANSAGSVIPLLHPQKCNISSVDVPSTDVEAADQANRFRFASPFASASASLVVGRSVDESSVSR